MSRGKYILCLSGVISLVAIGCAPAPRFYDDLPGRREAADKPPSGYHVGQSWTGMASYYGAGDKFQGGQTSSGEQLNLTDMTAAHRDLPFGTMLRVTNLNNGKICIVRVNDRGPFVRGRIVDLSPGAARELEMLGGGVAKVRIEIVSLGSQ